MPASVTPAAEFSVIQFFSDGTWEMVESRVSAEAAVLTARDRCLSPGALIGVPSRVIITDREDFIAFEWLVGKGVVFPPRYGAGGEVS